jgi:hypothetical protein
MAAKIQYLEINAFDNSIDIKNMTSDQKDIHESIKNNLQDIIKQSLDKQVELEGAIQKFVALGLSESDVRWVINNVNN